MSAFVVSLETMQVVVNSIEHCELLGPKGPSF